MRISPILFNNYNLIQNRHVNLNLDKALYQESSYTNPIPLYYKPLNFGSSYTLEPPLTKLFAKYTELKLFNKINIEPIIKLTQKLKSSTKQPITIGISGESGSGKSTISDWIAEILEENYNLKSHIIRRDQYLRDYSEKIKEYGCYNSYSQTGELEGSECVDFERIIENLKKNSKGEAFHPKKRHRESGIVEPYDYDTIIMPTPIIIVEGISIFGNKDLQKALDLTIYADAPDKLISKRWGKRSSSRGKIGEIAKNCYKVTKEKAKIYTIPYKNSSDIVINASSNKELLSSFIKEFINITKNKRKD